MLRIHLLCAGLLAAAVRADPSLAPDAATAPGQSGDAQAIYARVRPSLLQVRTIVQSAQGQSTLGSGFVVGQDGLAVTNYHVVSRYALEPKTYRLEFMAPDGSRGPLSLLAIDVADDLAVVRLQKLGLPGLPFDERALAEQVPKGERLFSLGNPLDLGFTIVEGTYNGKVERSYEPRVHFTGAINPGMSGGPAVTAEGKVVGINVSKRLGGELVSFLVPARFAAALVERARNSQPLGPADAKAEIGRQLLAREQALYEAVERDGFRAVDVGPYRAPETVSDWFSCWSNTNSDAQPKPRALNDTTACSADTSVFVAEQMQTGRIELRHSYLRSAQLNAFQFASFLSHNYSPQAAISPWGRRNTTTPRCNEDFVHIPGTRDGPTLHAAWCARAYRDYAGLYDVVITAVTADRSRESLMVQLSMQGVPYDTALSLGKRLLGTVAWAP
ncbi:MAG: trypsin-like peptidase domain-containing protein [Nevskia sp.]|nr:trypsin-like peptidase domain-containing protein [Nevskia sp.]